MALQFFRQLYSLDTLDTRFVVPATAPPKEALKEAELDPVGPLPIQSGKEKSRNAGNDVQPSRWNTAEFYVYYVSISASIFMMFKLVLECSEGPYIVVSGAMNTTDSIQNHIQPTLSMHICCQMDGSLAVKSYVLRMAYLRSNTNNSRTTWMLSTMDFDRTYPLCL